MTLTLAGIEISFNGVPENATPIMESTELGISILSKEVQSRTNPPGITLIELGIFILSSLSFFIKHPSPNFVIELGNTTFFKLHSPKAHEPIRVNDCGSLSNFNLIHL